MDAFSALEVGNSDALPDAENTTLLGKRRGKAPAAKAEKPLPAAARPSVATMKFVKEMADKRVDEELIGPKIVILNKISQLEDVFKGRFAAKRYKKLTIDNSIDEIGAQYAEMKNEFRNAQQMPAAKAAFKLGTFGIETLFTTYGFDLTGFSAIANEEENFDKYFKEPLALLTIDYGLFRQDPMSQLIFGLAQLGFQVSQMNKERHRQQAARDMTEEEKQRYANL